MTDREDSLMDGSATSDLERVVSTYRHQLTVAPHRAVTDTARTIGVSRATVIRRLAQARAAGLRVDFGVHAPATARWSDRSGPSWVACRKCHHVWPCPEAACYEAADPAMSEAEVALADRIGRFMAEPVITSPEEALKVTLENLRKTEPGDAVLAVIDTLEAEVAHALTPRPGSRASR